jgi:acetyl esterase/lipase
MRLPWPGGAVLRQHPVVGTLHLVDPTARDAISAMEPFDPAKDSLDKFRETVLALHADEAPPRQERMIPGPPGSSDLHVLVYRPDDPGERRPAVLYLHGGGFVAGTPDMMDGARFKLAQDHGVVVVAHPTGSRRKRRSPAR